MKNLMLIFLFALFSFSLFAQSNVKLGVQSAYYPTLNANFIGPSASIESSLRNHLSLNLAFAYLNDHNVIGVDADIITRGLRIEPSFRIFPKEGLKGFFIGGKMSYTNFTSFLKTSKDKVAFPIQADEDYVFGFGGMIGLQTNFLERFVLNAELGVELDGNEGELLGLLGISVGYNF